MLSDIKSLRICGCNLNNPNVQLSLLALVVIPELRLTYKGLVDGINFTFLPVVEGLAQ
jgi:adenine deaminase